MTAPLLLAWICAALLLQLVIGVAVAVWRRRGDAASTAATGAATAAAPPVPAGAWPGWRDFRVARHEFEDRAHSQCSFYLEPVDGAPLPPFEPGQFLTFSLQVADAAAPGGVRTITRCYSLSERPQPSHYRITVKRIAAPPDRPELPPGASSNHLHDRVHDGDVLQVKAPSGHFVIDRDAAVPAVLVAGGIGITPLLCMLRWCLAEQPGRTVHLFHGVRHSGEQAFKALLEQLAGAHACLHLHVVYSRPDPSDLPGRDFQHAGHVTLDLLRQTLPHGRHRFFICGPAAMMNSLVPALAAWGVPPHDIHHEAFGPASTRAVRALPAPTAPPAAAAAAVEVHFLRSGRTLAWDAQDESLLDFAERHGVLVDSGCRAGGCGTCETKLVAGSVHYAELPDHDIAPGHCLLCVGTPASPRLSLEA